MKTFEYKGDTLAIIDGDLWLKLPTGATPPISENVDVPKKRRKKRGRKPRVPEGEREHVESGVIDGRRGRKPRIEAETLELLKQDIRDGGPSGVIAAKHNVPVHVVYNTRLRMKADGEKLSASARTPHMFKRLDPVRQEIKTYQCADGHRFSSNLSQEDAKCPRCGAKALREITDQPIREDSEEQVQQSEN